MELRDFALEEVRELLVLAASAFLLTAPRVSSVGDESDANPLRGIRYAPIEAQQNEPGEKQDADCEDDLHCFFPLYSSHLLRSPTRAGE